MSTPRWVVALVTVTSWLCPTTSAPIHGGYPGLRSLIEQSQIIAAVTILQQLSEEDLGGSARYKIRFEKFFKGTASEKEAVVYLRNLEITPEPDPDPRRSFGRQLQPSIRYFAPTEQFEFRPLSRWVAFLTAGSDGSGAAYKNVNCEGSTFPLSPLRDLDALKVEGLPDTLILLFREYVEFKRANVAELEKQLEAFIHRGDG